MGYYKIIAPIKTNVVNLTFGIVADTVEEAERKSIKRIQDTVAMELDYFNCHTKENQICIDCYPVER